MFHVLGYLCVTSLKITQYGLVLFWYIESLAVTKSIIFFVLSDLEHVIEFIFSRFLTFFYMKVIMSTIFGGVLIVIFNGASMLCNKLILNIILLTSVLYSRPYKVTAL